MKKIIKYYLAKQRHWFKTRVALYVNRSRKHRQLEIGPGNGRILGFETLDVVPGKNVDYCWDATGDMPFEDGTFSTIYASHILEHVPWYMKDKVLKEWVRILSPGGVLEIWVPDGYKICKTLVDYEEAGVNNIHLDGWYRYNAEKDVYKWAAGRMFTYGDGSKNMCHQNWHRSCHTPKSLCSDLKKAGLIDVRLLHSSEVRGYDHGWISLGCMGVK